MLTSERGLVSEKVLAFEERLEGVMVTLVETRVREKSEEKGALALDRRYIVGI